MKVTWLGQAGLHLQMGGLSIIIDPYLSDSVGRIDASKSRRIPVDEACFAIEADVLAFTHDHLDHYDPETAERFLSQAKPMLVLGPDTCWSRARACGGNHNYVLFNPGTEWTQGSVHFTAVPAIHSGNQAVGLILKAEGKTVYVTGDTLYGKAVLQALPEGIDYLFLPINGVGNNMNMVDAARFAKECGAATVIPLHVGLMDGLDANDFECPNKRVLEVYKETEL